jgi:hypothetical protein
MSMAAGRTLWLFIASVIVTVGVYNINEYGGKGDV